MDTPVTEGFVKILKRFNEGSIIVRSNDLKSIQIDIEKNRKTLDIHDMSFDPNDDNIFTKITKARNLGKILKENDQTLVLCFKGKPVMKFGKEANPKLSLFATFSRDVEVTDLLELRRLGKRLDSEK